MRKLRVFFIKEKKRYYILKCGVRGEKEIGICMYAVLKQATFKKE